MRSPSPSPSPCSALASELVSWRASVRQQQREFDTAVHHDHPSLALEPGDGSCATVLRGQRGLDQERRPRLAHRADRAPCRPQDAPALQGARSRRGLRPLAERPPSCFPATGGRGRATAGSRSFLGDPARRGERLRAPGAARPCRPQLFAGALNRSATNAATLSREGCPQPMQNGWPAGSAYTPCPSSVSKSPDWRSLAPSPIAFSCAARGSSTWRSRCTC